MNQSKGKARPNTSNRNRNVSRVARGEYNAMNEYTAGGTGDIKPELLSFSATQSAADTTTTATQALPILRNFSTGGNKAQIIEVLKVWAFTNATNSPEVDSSLTWLLGTKNFAATAINAAEPSVFAAGGHVAQITTSGTFLRPVSECVDVTDGNGNGVLVATDNIFAQIQSASTGVAVAIRFKILYRVYGAKLIEYVGIVQGQQ